MPAVTARNTRQADTTAPQPALRDDGTPYALSMFYSDSTRVAYADTPAELVAVLAGNDGYPDLDEQSRLEARLHVAVDAQVALQAQINAEADLSALTDEQRQVLTGPRHVPPAPQTWEPDVPLVLVDVFYQPWPDGLPRPSSAQGDFASADNLVWLSAAEDWDLLSSLHQTGRIELHELVG